MAILKRIVPEPTNIKDYRNSGGIYYEAECEQCGRDYWPKRKTSIYCSKTCADQAALGYTNMDFQGKRPIEPATVIMPRKRVVKSQKKLEEKRIISEALEKARKIIKRVEESKRKRFPDP